MTRMEKGLQFAARALGVALLWGVWVQFVDVPIFKGKSAIALLIAVAAVMWLLLTLITKALLRIRYPQAVWLSGRAFVSGVVTGFVIAALVLLVAELMTALVSMMTLAKHGG